MNHQHLPEEYVAEDGQRTSAPVYELLADGYYDDSLWLAEEHIATDMTPNHHMRPLNKAAGERMELWLSTLPGEGQNLRIDDLTEAAFALRPKVGEADMTTEQFQAAVIKLATQLKAKREGGSGMVIPPIVQSASGRKAPPISNARIESARGFEIAEREVQQMPQRERKVQRAKQAMGSVG